MKARHIGVTALLILGVMLSVSAMPIGAAVTPRASKLTNVKVVLGWVVSPEFAGFYAAKAEGFYKDFGLNVTIQPGGPTVNTEQLTGSGNGVFGTDDFGNMLAANDSGTNLVGLMQIATKPALRLISLKSAHLTSPTQWKGKTIGVFAGDSPLYSTLTKYGISTKDVKLVEQGSNMSQFTSGQLNLASGFAYNEVGQIIAAGIPLSKLNLYDYTSDGTANLEDSLFANANYVAAHPSVAAAMVAGTIKGMIYCSQNPKSCVQIVSANGAEESPKFQLWSMNTINSLWFPAPDGFGYMNPSLVQQTINILYQGKVINHKPQVSSVIDTSVYNAGLKLLGNFNTKVAPKLIPNLAP